MKINQVVIATAGYSTRYLPICKSVPKPMLPILDVPIIHELVKECIDSGIKDIIIVTSFGNGAVEDYFDNRPDLETYLKDTGKEDRYSRFYEVFGKANIVCVRQNKALPYGNGSPVLAAKPWLKEGEPFAFMFGDDMVLSDVPAIKQMIDLYESHSENPNIGGVVAGQLVPKEETYAYGIVKFKDENQELIERLVEKPSVEEAPSNFATYGRYVVSYDIFKYLDPTKLLKNELYFPDALDRLCAEKDVYAKVVDGEWITTGDPLNHLKAILKYAMRRPEYKSMIEEVVNGK